MIREHRVAAGLLGSLLASLVLAPSVSAHPATPAHLPNPELARTTSLLPSTPAPAGEPVAGAHLAPESIRAIDHAVQAAIDRDEVPGAVVVVLARGRVTYRKAYGLRAVMPSPLPMMLDTVFDLASLTKPIVTALGVMRLHQQRVLSLRASLGSVLPICAGTGVGKATVEQLLLHTSGLPAADELMSYPGDHRGRVRHLCALPLSSLPGTVFRYSDLGYILLGEAIMAASGMPLDRFAHDRIFVPLGMTETGFNPDYELTLRAAPTEPASAADGHRAGADEVSLVGRVHDPRARRLGGVAGHAGVFSTGDDVARFVAALLDPRGARASGLSAESLRAFLAPRDAGGQSRAYAGRIDGSTVGHTGFTGTGFWVDPRRGRGVVILANRLHPHGKGSAGRLRRDVIMAAMAARLEPD